MYDDDNDDRFTLADSLSNDNDDILMDDSQSNIVVTDYDSPFEDDTNLDDDDSPFMDDSLNDVDHPLPSHESYPTQYMQLHPSTHSGRIDLPGSSQMPPSFEIPPDIIAQLTPAELAHNPEFMRLQELFHLVQNTVSALESTPRYRQRVQARERILEWRSGIHA